MILRGYADGNHGKYWCNMMKIRCLSNSLYSLMNCHKQFGRSAQYVRVFFFNFPIYIFSGRFDTSGSMIPRLVPEIAPSSDFCDGRVAVAGEEELDILVG